MAVIGTGASAIQFVPEIARTPRTSTCTSAPRPTCCRSPTGAYRPGEQALFDRLPALRKADRLRIFLCGELLTSGFVLSPKLLAAPMPMWRRQLDARSRDPELRGQVRPGLRMGCKRVLFSNDWYPTLARPNVELVTDPIERIAPDGVVTADGTHRPADVIIYGTGFQTARLPGADVGDRPGRRAACARPGATAPQAYLGITVAGFPNFFMLYGPNTNLGGNSIIYMLEGQIGYVVGRPAGAASRTARWLDVRPEVQRRVQ